MQTQPRLLLGLDGGGTSCRARLSNSTGRTLGEGKAGPANAFYDPEGSWTSIYAATRMAFASAGVDMAECRNTAACLGLAGLNPLSPQAPADWPLSDFLSCIIETDAMIALRGAHAGADGAILIVGTGSVGLAAIGAQRVSVGGYGSVLGDEGSGGWLGRAAARRMLWSVDGRLPWSRLSRDIEATLGSPTDAIEWARSATAADFAALAPLVISAACDGDEIAISLVQEAAQFLAKISARLAEAGAKSLSILGGLAVPLEPWLCFEKLSLVPPKGDALSGAIGIASGI